MVPSLVTWPTRRSAKPRRLARRMSSDAEARTWATVPGAESSTSTYMVWMESTTTTSGGVRSEEHTSELQSLMRISYAVFCLNKNKNHTYAHIHTYLGYHHHQ